MHFCFLLRTLFTVERCLVRFREPERDGYPYGRKPEWFNSTEECVASFFRL